MTRTAAALVAMTRTAAALAAMTRIAAALAATTRIVAALAALGLLSPATAAAQDRRPADELPVLARLQDGPTPVIVRGELAVAQARAMVTLARQVYTDVNRRFVARAPRARQLPVTLCLLASERGYRDFVLRQFGPGDHSPLGFYDPNDRIAVVNLARGAGNLRHELVHPLLGDDFPGIPSWLNEGIGALYGTSVPGRGGRFRFLVNYRLRDLQAALRAGDLPDLDALVDADADEIYGDRAMVYYALSRYLLLYLEQQGELERFYRAVRAAGADPDAQRDLLGALVDQRQFVAWARGLRYRR